MLPNLMTFDGSLGPTLWEKKNQLSKVVLIFYTTNTHTHSNTHTINHSIIVIKIGGN